MSPTDTAFAGPIPLTVTGSPKGATIVVYDSGNRIVTEESGGSDVVVRLARGFYTVRATIGADSDEVFVRLDAPKSIAAPLPARYSPAPIAGGALTHEYYSITSRDFSRTKTRGALNSSALEPAELFVFVRALDRESYGGEDLAEDLQLLSGRGLRLSSFAEDETKRDTQYGWLAFCAEAAPGFYRLAVGGAQPREIAVHLFPNWQTQVFVLHRARPLVECLRVFMSPVGNGFEPDDDVAAAVDDGLQALQSGTAVVPDATLDLFLHNEFKNPMLGFIGAHLLLRAARAEPAESEARSQRREVMREVLGNLASLAPFAPDTVTLEVLAHDELGLDPPRESGVSLPPMLRAGYAALVAAAAGNPALIPEASLSDDISDRILSDSPWTSWESRPIAFRGITTSRSTWGRRAPRMPRSRGETYTLGPDPGGMSYAIGSIVDICGSMIGGLRELPVALTWPWRRIDWLERAVIGEILHAERSGKRELLDEGGIARRLGVSPHAIRRVVEDLNRVSLDAVLEKADVDVAMRGMMGRTGRRMSDFVSR